MKKIANIYQTSFDQEFINLDKIISIEKCIRVDDPNLYFNSHNDARIGFRVICESKEKPIICSRDKKDSEFIKNDKKEKGLLMEDGSWAEMNNWGVTNYKDYMKTMYAKNVEKERQDLVNAWKKYTSMNEVK